MSGNYFGIIEEGLTAAIVIGFCLWELHQLRKIKDKNRKSKRGHYMVPEVADYILSVMPNEKSATQDATANSAEMEPAAV